jgi:hypothetical protein
LKAASPTPPNKSFHIIASCQAGQRGLPLSDKPQGQFAAMLADGFSGRADKNRDNRLEVTELYEHLQAKLADLNAGRPQSQTPALFLPNEAVPPRLAADAQQAVRTMLTHLTRTKLDEGTAVAQFEAARKLAGDQPDARLAHSLVMFKFNKSDRAIPPLEEVRLSRPEITLAHEMAAWIHFYRRDYHLGLNALSQLATVAAARREPDQPYAPEIVRTFDWIGRLREFATLELNAGDNRVPALAAQLDTTVGKLDPALQDAYAQGREHSRTVDKEFGAAEVVAAEIEKPKVRSDRRQLRNYADFAVDDAAARLLGFLDQHAW